ncbi:MAG TPA: phage terminase large subunit [Tepidisphaeraceae bacterium]
MSQEPNNFGPFQSITSNSEESKTPDDLKNPEKLSTDLRLFIQAAWPTVEPHNTFIPGPHLDAVAEHLEAVSNGQIRNLLINIPPRHMKSLAVSVFWPVWEWIRFPHRRWLYSSYALSLAIRDSVRCRRLIESDWFQEKWGNNFQLAADQNTKHRFDNDRSGCRLSVSVGGAATGEGGDRVVCDDPHSVTERESETSRRAVLDWWDQTMSTRLNDPKAGARVIVMQRIHENDLSAHVLAQGGYDHLCLPAEFDPSRRCVIVATNWRDNRETPGQLLWPARFSETEIADLKLRLGPSGYAGQFQQAPVPASGARFQKEWFCYYEVLPNHYRLTSPNGSTRTFPIEKCDRFAVMDPAGTEPTQNTRPCYTVIQVWDITPEHDMLLVYQYRAQVQTPDATEAAARILRDYKANFLAVEKDGLGLGICQTLRRQGLTIKAIKARGSKEARSEIAEIRMAAGLIWFPQGAEFVFNLEQELLHFPKSEYADQVDALAHAAIHVQNQREPPRTRKPPAPTTPTPELTLVDPDFDPN